MHSENNELAKAGHELAKCLDSNTPLTEIAKLIARLATALDVTTVAVREATKQRDAEHNDVLVWEKTMFKVCGEDGAKSVAEKFASLEASRAALAAECASTQAYLRNGPVINKGGELLAAHQFAPATPAIDAFLREVKAQGVEMFSEQQRSFIGKPSKNDAASSYCSREAIKFADQLRQGGAA
ncbi:hypothetical protein N3K64_04740 [Escherichia coli]|uniref:hypothetical protein n=1 Tax=Escherichia coli TaxID=562 RepID=UPI0021C2518A|nr:hypothetical protein [Escherichia coli]MCT9829197.1 hypothetical protein [Escherichia coli]